MNMHFTSPSGLSLKMGLGGGHLLSKGECFVSAHLKDPTYQVFLISQDEAACVSSRAINRSRETANQITTQQTQINCTGFKPCCLLLDEVPEQQLPS